MENSEGAKMEVVKIINIFGDFVPINRGIASVADGTAVEKGILSVLEDSDYNIINLECPVVVNPHAKAILKDGPNLRCSDQTLEYLKSIGFNLCTLANNHFKDFGVEGIEDTFKACKDNAMEWVGAGLNIRDARIPKILEIKGMKIGIVNICENESSIATNNEAGSNPIDEINNYYDITNLKEKVEKIILIIHGGVEHYRFPSPRMKKLCHFYAELGVSAIVCHHTHCYSGYEVYHDVPIFYSLGNFFFDREEMPSQWKTGFFVQLQITKDKVGFNLYPYLQCDKEAVVRVMDEQENNEFRKTIKEINAIISDDNALNAKYDAWLEKRNRHYLTGTMTWGGRYYKAAYRRKLVPSFISKRNAVILLNYIRCETHHDLLIWSLKKYISR